MFEFRNKIFILTLISGLLFIFSFCFGYQVQSQEVSVVFNELSWAGSSYFSNDEFIELKNVTDQDLEISGWYFTKLSSGEEKDMLFIPGNTIVASNDFFVISNFSSIDSVLNIDPDLEDSAISLSNSSLQIKLYNSDGELVDVAGDGETPLAGNNDTKVSMIRNIPIEAGDSVFSWSSSLIAENLDEDIEDLTTPGADNFEKDEIDPPVISTGDTTPEIATNEQLPVASDDEIISIASDDTTATTDELPSQDNATDDALPDLQDDLGKLLINEVAFRDSVDWIELKVIQEGLFKDWKVYQGTSLVFEIVDNSIFEKNDLILLNLEKNLTATDNILVVKNSADQVEDILIWSNANNSFSKSKLQANQLVEDRHWLSTEDFNDNDLGAWTNSDDVKEGMSLIRLTDLDTNSFLDWNLTFSATPGTENELKLTEEEIIQEEEDNINEEEKQDELIEDTKLDLKNKLVISEIVSHPFPGQTEWIEIYNNSDTDIDVTEFYVQEGSGTKFELNGIINSKFYMVIKTKNLNNAGDMVQLYSNDEMLLDEMVYGDLDNSIVKFDSKKVVLPYALVKDSTGFWKLTTIPTPGSENILQESVKENDSEKEKPAEKKSVKSSKTKTSASKKTSEKKLEYVELNQQNITELKADSLVIFDGVITVEPGTFYKQKMYAQNKDLAIEIYFYKAEWPDLSVGQKVRVKGKFSNSELARVKLTSAEDIEILGQGDAELKEFEFGEKEKLKGFLVAADGEVSEKLASGFNLVTENGDIPVCFKKNAGLKTSDLENGQRIFVSGLLLPGKNDLCITPRISEDLSVLPSEVELGATIVEELPVKKGFPVRAILLTIAGILSAGIGFLYLFKKGKLKMLRFSKA